MFERDFHKGQLAYLATQNSLWEMCWSLRSDLLHAKHLTVTSTKMMCITIAHLLIIPGSPPARLLPFFPLCTPCFHISLQLSSWIYVPGKILRMWKLNTRGGTHFGWSSLDLQTRTLLQRNHIVMPLVSWRPKSKRETIIWGLAPGKHWEEIHHIYRGFAVEFHAHEYNIW